MNPLKTRALTRQQIGQFIGSERGVRAFEDAQADITESFDALVTASFLTLTNEPTLGSERVLTLVDGELIGDDAGANSTYTLGLADTAVVPDDYGDDSHFVKISVDQKGRITSADVVELNTDNITEGTTNLFYTDARARAALSAGNGINYDSTTGVIAAKAAGTYGAPTGTLSRSIFASYTAGTTLTFSASYVQSELNAAAARIAAMEANLQAISRVLAALVTDLKANGNLT